VDNIIFLLITGLKNVYKIEMTIMTLVINFFKSNIYISCNMDIINVHDYYQNNSFFSYAHILLYIIAADVIKQYNYIKQLIPVVTKANEVAQFIFTGRYHQYL